jgi:oligoendopeptidase F
MFASLPPSALDFMDWPWARIEPYFQDLLSRQVNQANVEAWLSDWTRLANLLSERFTRLEIATTVDTTDEEAKKRYNGFLDEIYPHAESMEHKLKQKLLESGVEPADFEIPLRNMRAEVEIFKEENLPLLSHEMKLSIEYDKISGAQSVEWEGEELTVLQLKRVYQDLDRDKRERAWKLGAQRQLEDRQALNELWQNLLQVRLEIAENAGKADFRAYQWQRFKRFDYTPQDCKSFHEAIEEVVVPAAERIYEKRRERLGVARLRPWDLTVDALGREPLRPFEDVDELKSTAGTIFQNVDPQLGKYFEIMRRETLLDLYNRKGKAQGGYCADFEVIQRPFIFMNAVGLQEDVQTLLHEGGHAFHVFETSQLPYHQQLQVGMEFAEVASMGMELLASPYLAKEMGGFYSPVQAARARIEHLDEDILRFWPYMAVVDAFQHWVYENPEQAADPSNCDATWSDLWRRFMRGVDWSGLEDEMATGWQRKLHIFQIPFYYVEYGLAQLGAVQVWRNAVKDQDAAVAAYRKALSLGGTRPLPELFAAAGAKFAFDADTLHMAVDAIETTIDRLEEENRVR